jgi:hypothetical protein
MNPTTGPRRTKTKVVPKEEPVVIDYSLERSPSPIPFIAIFTWVIALTLFMILHVVFHPVLAEQAQQPQQLKKRDVRFTTFNISSSSPKIMEIPLVHQNVHRYSVCCTDEDTQSCEYASGITVTILRMNMIRILVRDARSARCIIRWKEP